MHLKAALCGLLYGCRYCDYHVEPTKVARTSRDSRSATLIKVAFKRDAFSTQWIDRGAFHTDKNVPNTA